MTHRSRPLLSTQAAFSLEQTIERCSDLKGVVKIEPADFSKLPIDRPISGLREQFRNRARTATRGIDANLSMVGRLAPWRHPRTALAIWSHKLLRWATPWWVVAAGVSSTLLALGGRVGYGIVPLGIALAAAAAVTAHLISRTGRKPPRPLAFARAFAVVNLAFGLAWLNVIRGRRIEAWHRAEWRVEG